MNPDTHLLEKLTNGPTPSFVDAFKQAESLHTRSMADMLSGPQKLLRPNGDPVPDHWTIFKRDELVNVKGHTFKVAYMNEGAIMLEPVKPEDCKLCAE